MLFSDIFDFIELHSFGPVSILFTDIGNKRFAIIQPSNYFLVYENKSLYLLISNTTSTSAPQPPASSSAAAAESSSSSILFKTETKAFEAKNTKKSEYAIKYIKNSTTKVEIAIRKFEVYNIIKNASNRRKVILFKANNEKTANRKIFIHDLINECLKKGVFQL